MIKEAEKSIPISFTADAELLKLVDGEMWARKCRNRSDMIRSLIREGLYRAARLRAAKKPVELTSEKTEVLK